ncbi:MAG: hypothetical protein EHM72_08990 [Calditrichaeota bacterium]|nr:MAG: hypothetical protein EHM72_08990 [Calditrichota bacterium]
MKTIGSYVALMMLVLSFSHLQAKQKNVTPKAPWCSLHLLNFDTDSSLLVLEKQLPELALKGVNVLILEVDYGFKFRSHPELRGSDHPVTKKGAGRLVKACRANHILLIPQFQCFGHQSWAKTTYPLLTRYPELDITPGAFPQNEGIYCREWDPMNPRVYDIVFKLIDEIMTAFDADFLHVGMDEVFLIGHELSPSTKGLDPAPVFAQAVNDLYDHIVRKRGKQMLMWGDRLIDGRVYDYGEWEASMNGTAAAVDIIPKDIIICDWHYEVRESYPSTEMFLQKGFRVLPAGWRNVEASRAFINYSLALGHSSMLGHLFTRWSSQREHLAEFPPLLENASLLKQNNYE